MRQLTIINSITIRDSTSLDKYLADVSKEKMISAEEEVELTKKIRGGNQLALEKMVKANLRFVVSVAKQYQGQGMALIDLISEGNLGLIKAAKRFDETRGFKFISYAVWWIRQAIIQCISERSRAVRLPINQIANLKKVKKAFADFEQQHQRPPSIDELAEFSELPIDLIETSLRNIPFPLSIDAPIGDSETLTIGDTLTNSSNNADEKLLTESLQIEVKEMLSCLSFIESKIIIQLFGIGINEAVTLSDIASQLDLSNERVRQIKERALRKLRVNPRNKNFDF